MAVKVTLQNPSRITRRSPNSNTTTSTPKFDRAFYQYLGSLVKNKTLLDDYQNEVIPLEYRRLLDEMSDLCTKRNYPLLGADIVIEEGIVALDEYLGTLGIDLTYPYEKDIVNISAWLEINSQTEYRILVDLKDNTYLTTSNGNEILVVYT